MRRHWGAACSFHANDYAVYQGTIGNWYSHAKLACSTAGLTSATVTPTLANAYYLVVPRDGQSEGSYGVNSAGAEIPAATPAANQCAGQVTPAICDPT